MRVMVALVLAMTTTKIAAQPATETRLIFANELEEQARVQLRRLLDRYDVDSWMFTDTVRIVAGVEPRSMPVLILNTAHLDDDLRQLSIFLHEQAHWHVDAADQRGAAISELRSRYPNAPEDSDRLYQHILVAWIELDAMTELIGEDEARTVMRSKVEALTVDLDTAVAESYRWYNERALEDTAVIGSIVSRHGMTITPDHGLIVK